MLIFELGQLRHRLETIGLAHSQYHVFFCNILLFARRFETILGWASQDVVNGQTKSGLLASWQMRREGQIPLSLLNIV